MPTSQTCRANLPVSSGVFRNAFIKEIKCSAHKCRAGEIAVGDQIKVRCDDLLRRKKTNKIRVAIGRQAGRMALFLPKGSPLPIVRKLHDAAVATLNTPAVQTRLREIGVEPVASERRTSEYLATFVQSEIGKWAGLIKAAGINTY
jgi:hypothetical protein